MSRYRKRRPEQANNAPSSSNHRERINRALQEGRDTPSATSLTQRRAIKSTLDLFK